MLENSHHCDCCWKCIIFNGLPGLALTDRHSSSCIQSYASRLRGKHLRIKSSPSQLRTQNSHVFQNAPPPHFQQENLLLGLMQWISLLLCFHFRSALTCKILKLFFKGHFRCVRLYRKVMCLLFPPNWKAMKLYFLRIKFTVYCLLGLFIEENLFSTDYTNWLSPYFGLDYITHILSLVVISSLNIKWS